MRIDIQYDQKFDDTIETKKLITAFGLDEIKHNVICKAFDYNPKFPSITYICGYSGSGKSSILREISKQLLDAEDTDTVFIEKWQDLPIDNKPLVEFHTDLDVEKRLGILSKCGLGEAWKFISRYGDLSDGEKFRFVLYNTIMQLRNSKKTNKVLILDEFCATLDRTTAKAIANNIEKLSKEFGITFILASAHDDLTDYIHADYNIFKEYEEHVEVKEAD